MDIKTKLKYTVIKTESQYFEYCDILEELVFEQEGAEAQEEIELLTVLIEKWDRENNTFKESDPVEVIKELMEANALKAKDLVETLGISKSTVSKILNYQKGLSKEVIRKLSERFKVSQEVFNRPYELNNSVLKSAGAKIMNTKKEMACEGE